MNFLGLIEVDFFSLINLFLLIVIILFFVAPLLIAIYLYYFDKNQKQHAVLRNYPVVGRFRYLFEMIGPEMRQYFFDSDTESKPFSRVDFQSIIFAAKYLKTIISFGSKRDFEQPGFYIKNALFPTLMKNMRIDQSLQVKTKKYITDSEKLTSRKEHIENTICDPWLLDDKDAIVIGPKCKYPFILKGQIGMSGMSYGALGENAISALSIGLGNATGSFMNTGEGGLSDYHLQGNTDIIMQIGPGLFGVCDEDGNLSYEELRIKGEIKNVKAFELKLGQGAKIRGGHLPASKNTPPIAKSRCVKPGVTLESPNRFKEFYDVPSLFDFVDKIRELTGKPVGIKIVIGGSDSVEELASYMRETGRGPDFISIDGGEGGSGATYSEMADSMGLPIKSAIPIVDLTLKKYGVRDRVKIIASGKLFTADRIAVALGMGADLVSIARAFMITVGCIGAQHCHKNTCPVGVATTDPKLQKALVIDEKKYRVTNYVLTLRKSLYCLSAASGLKSPVEFSHEHIVHVNEQAKVTSLKDIYKNEIEDIEK